MGIAPTARFDEDASVPVALVAVVDDVLVVTTVVVPLLLLLLSESSTDVDGDAKGMTAVMLALMARVVVT